MFEDILTLFKDNEWSYEPRGEDSKIISSIFDYEQKKYKLILGLNDSDDIFTVISYVSHAIPEENYIQMLDLINRVNLTFLIGNYELNTEENLIRLRISSTYDNQHMEMATVLKLLFSNLVHISIMDGAVEELISKKINIEQAVDKFKIDEEV